VRPRAFHLWTGVAYYDDFELSPLSNTNLVAPVASFESGKPSLWNAVATSGAVLTWATDQARTSPRSLKIEKTGTGEAARWISGNQVRYWVDKISKSVDIKVGAWVRQSGLNTSPANDNARWQLKFWFYDSANTLIGGQPFTLNVDQSVATKDWYEVTNTVGSLILPRDAYRLIIAAEAGPNATGTMWFDNFTFVGRTTWAGQNWNGFVDADSGWQYWIAPDGGNDGRTLFPGSGVSTEAARTGKYSLKITAPVGRQAGELVWFTETVPIPLNSKGKKYVLSAWVKTSQIQKDSVFNPSYALGFTWTWHTKLFADAGGWNEFSSGEYRFVLNKTEQDWTQYQVIIEVPDNSVTAVSVRPRAFHLWTGISYYDDFSSNAVEAVVTSVESDKPRPVSGIMPIEYSLEQNYPNPFNPSTTIDYSLPVTGAVRLEIFNALGQKVRTLVNEVQNVGKWTVRWNGRDDFGANVASGVYFYRLTTPTVVLTQKMLLLK
jgi:hypothetical protein